MILKAPIYLSVKY